MNFNSVTRPGKTKSKQAMLNKLEIRLHKDCSPGKNKCYISNDNDNLFVE